MEHSNFQITVYALVFAAVGGLIGYIEDWSLPFWENGGFFPELFGLLIAPCLMCVAALLSWDFKHIETYARAVALCAILIVSFEILRSAAQSTLGGILPYDSISWDIFCLFFQGLVWIFSMFSFVIRAMLSLRRRLDTVIFVSLGATTYLVNADYITQITAFGSAGHSWLWPVCQYAALLAGIALAASAAVRNSLPRRAGTLVMAGPEDVEAFERYLKSGSGSLKRLRRV